MHQIKPVDGLRLSDYLDALRAQLEASEQLRFAALPPSTVIHTVDAEPLVRLIEPASSQGARQVLLARGLYRVDGRIVDTCRWPEVLRSLQLPALRPDEPHWLDMTVTWEDRPWRRAEGRYEPSAPPVKTGDLEPIETVSVVAEQPSLSIACRKAAPKGLVLGRLIPVTRGVELDPGFLPPCASFGATVSARAAVETVFEPLVKIAERLEPCAERVGERHRRRIDAVAVWAAAIRDLLIRPNESVDSILEGIQNVNGRLLRHLPYLSASEAPLRVDSRFGLVIKELFDIAALRNALESLCGEVDAPANAVNATIQIDSSELEIARHDGKWQLVANLGRPLIERLGGRRNELTGIEMTVVPTMPGAALRPIGSSVVHPWRDHTMLPAALGAIETVGMPDGSLQLSVRFAAVAGNFGSAITELLDESRFRLVLATHAIGGHGNGEMPPLSLLINARY